MKEIMLTNGGFAAVDDGDYVWLSQWSWYACKKGRNLYACRMTVSGKRRMVVYMHRAIVMKKTGGCPRLIDHHDRNGLNNQKNNLREASRSTNAMNQTKMSGKKSSIFKGVSRDVSRKKWQAYVNVDKKRITLGRFDTEREAAVAYNLMATQLHGEFACLNKVEKCEG